MRRNRVVVIALLVLSLAAVPAVAAPAAPPSHGPLALVAALWQQVATYLGLLGQSPAPAKGHHGRLLPTCGDMGGSGNPDGGPCH